MTDIEKILRENSKPAGIVEFYVQHEAFMPGMFAMTYFGSRAAAEAFCDSRGIPHSEIKTR